MRKEQRLTKKQYAAYLRSDHWRDVRKRFWRSQYPKVCCVCHAADRPLDLHHKSYERLGRERLSDLALLCRRCHREVHKVENKKKRKSKKKPLATEFSVTVLPEAPLPKRLTFGRKKHKPRRPSS